MYATFTKFYDYFTEVINPATRGSIHPFKDRIEAEGKYLPDQSVTIPGWQLDPVTGRYAMYDEKEYNTYAIQDFPYSKDAVQLKHSQNKPMSFQGTQPGEICPHFEYHANRFSVLGYRPTSQTLMCKDMGGTPEWESLWLNSIPRVTPKTSSYSEYPVRGY